MIHGFKDIAHYVNGKASSAKSVEAIRKASRRRKDPLPVRPFDGRISADPKTLDAWIARQSVRRIKQAS